MSFRGRDEHPEELISASLTGDLDANERTILAEHLAGCASCRETLAAFEEERRLVRGVRHVDPPRDLKARVDAGIDTGRFGPAPWWRRSRLLVGGGAAAATVVAGILAVVLLGDLRPAPVADATSTPTATTVATPAASVAAPSAAESLAPTPEPLIALRAGDVGFFVATGGTPSASRQLAFGDAAGGESISIDASTGPPTSAALSPNGEWLAWIERRGESGAQEVRAMRLTDGMTVVLGCSAAWAFTDRLAWSPNGNMLAYTLAGIDLGASVPECADTAQPVEQVDAWIFNTFTGEHTRFTDSGDAYAADFRDYIDVEGGSNLLVSHAAARPWTEELRAPSAVDGSPSTALTRADDVFMPRLSVDGTRALYWQGTMDQIGGTEWVFVAGGLPQISAATAGAGSGWTLAADGAPLFRDLEAAGGPAFAYGNFAWSPDGSQVAFWNGAWNGVPQSADGTYPSQADGYVGSSETGLDKMARVDELDPAAYVEDMKFEVSTNTVLVMIAWPSAGVGDAPSAEIWRVYVDRSAAAEPLQGGAVDPTPWYGPPVVGQDPVTGP